MLTKTIDTGRKIYRTIRSKAHAAQHLYSEFIYRVPTVRFLLKPKLALVRELKNKGIIEIAPGTLKFDIKKAQIEFEEMINSIKSNPSTEMVSAPKPWSSIQVLPHEVDKEIDVIISRDPFIFSSQFLMVASDSNLWNIARSYFGSDVVLNQATASRYLQTDKRDFGSWQWHHDAWGKKINVMLLLTDVTEDDQYMSFLIGSHKRFINLDRTKNSRFTIEEVNLLNKQGIKKCIGPAGTIFIFDANGLHAGRRVNEGAIRDSLIFSFNKGRFTWKLTANKLDYDSLNIISKKNILANKNFVFV
jgi:hypothetical protein